MADWICAKCGGEAADHADPKSTSFSCIWEPLDTDWLAERERRVAERAWAEGLAKAVENSYLARNGLVPNPYSQTSVNAGGS